MQTTFKTKGIFIEEKKWNLNKCRVKDTYCNYANICFVLYNIMGRMKIKTKQD